MCSQQVTVVYVLFLLLLLIGSPGLEEIPVEFALLLFLLVDIDPRYVTSTEQLDGVPVLWKKHASGGQIQMIRSKGSATDHVNLKERCHGED